MLSIVYTANIMSLKAVSSPVTADDGMQHDLPDGEPSSTADASLSEASTSSSATQVRVVELDKKTLRERQHWRVHRVHQPVEKYKGALYLPPCRQKAHKNIKFIKAPVTTAIAQGDRRYDGDNHMGYDLHTWLYLKEQLEQCMKIMYKPELDTHVIGYDVPCKMSLALKGQWTVTPSMSSDGMPQTERDTVLAVLEVVERYLFRKNPYLTHEKHSLKKMYTYLENVARDHFIIRQTVKKRRDQTSLSVEPTTLFYYPRLEKFIVRKTVKHGLFPRRKSHPSKPYGSEDSPIMVYSSDDESD